jgi:hypothetical protein
MAHSISVYPNSWGKPRWSGLDGTVAELASRQHGVVTRQQLLRIGLHPRSIEHRLTRGRLHPLYRGIYVVGHPHLSKEGRWLAADLRARDQRVIVLAHQRLDVANHYGVKNSPQVREILEASGQVLAVFQGHSHANDYREINGIHYCVLEAMVEGSGPENSGYSVLHLFPDQGVPGEAWPAGRRLVLGDPTTGRQAWRIGPPFGRDLLAVFVSERPLYRARRPQIEPIPAYLDFLRGRLNSAAPGDAIRFHYQLVTTVPRDAVVSGDEAG